MYRLSSQGRGARPHSNVTGFRQPFQKMDMRAAHEPSLVREA